MKVLLLCLATVAYVSSASVGATDDNRCSGCQAAVMAIENTLKADLSVVIEGAHKACAASKLGKDVIATCNSVVDGLPAVATAIVNNLPPHATCTMAKYCSPKAENIFANFMRSAAMRSEVGSDINWGPVECNFCEMAINFLDQNFLSPQFQTDILKGLNHICELIKGDMGQQCTAMLGSYGDMILKYIQSLLSGDHICPMVGACKSSSETGIRMQ